MDPPDEITMTMSFGVRQTTRVAENSVSEERVSSFFNRKFRYLDPVAIVSGCSCIHPVSGCKIRTENSVTWIRLQLYPVATVSTLYPVAKFKPKIPFIVSGCLYPVAENSVLVHLVACIRLQKNPLRWQLYPVAMYPVATVSGCNCIWLYPVTE